MKNALHDVTTFEVNAKVQNIKYQILNIKEQSTTFQ